MADGLSVSKAGGSDRKAPHSIAGRHILLRTPARAQSSTALAPSRCFFDGGCVSAS